MRKIVGVLLVSLFLIGGLYASGTRAGTLIQSASTNIVLEYQNAVGTTATQDASANSIPDVTSNVMEIEGLVETGVDIASLLDRPSSDVVVNTTTYRLFQYLVPGQDYTMEYTVLNRGNNDEEVRITADIEQEATRWTISGLSKTLALPTVNLIEDQSHTFMVTVNPLTAFAFERATVDVSIGLVNTTNVVSYNAFAGAVSDMQNGGYGGEGLFAYHYILEAEGFELTFINREIEFETPPLYTGEAGTEASLPPGSKVTFNIIIKNESDATVTSANLYDIIPNDCHLYYTEAPTVEGALLWEWKGAEDNNATGADPTAVWFELTIGGGETITASYTVTID